MDDFRKGSREWGSKARKEEKAKCRAKLKRRDAKEPREPTGCDDGSCEYCQSTMDICDHE